LDPKQVDVSQISQWELLPSDHIYSVRVIYVSWPRHIFVGHGQLTITFFGSNNMSTLKLYIPNRILAPGASSEPQGRRWFWKRETLEKSRSTENRNSSLWRLSLKSMSRPNTCEKIVFLFLGLLVAVGMLQAFLELQALLDNGGLDQTVHALLAR
jgi:hypothetical protein